MKVKIKWANKYSGETGFVKSLNEDKTDFINTTDETEAEEFSSETAKEIISSLRVNQGQNEYITVKPEVEKTEKVEKKTTKTGTMKSPKAKTGRATAKTKQ